MSDLRQQAETTRQALDRLRNKATNARTISRRTHRYGPSPTLGDYEEALALADALLSSAERAETVVEAARAFADPYNWHANYDGAGIIFQPDGAYSEERCQAFVDALGAALAELDAAAAGERAKPWLCTRHRAPDEVLSEATPERGKVLVCEETQYGRFWGGFWGFTHGPGFQAWAEDFPPGTRLIVTARVELPADLAEGESAPSAATGSTP